MLIGQILRELAKQPGLVQRKDRAATENAGIAIGRLAAGLATVDEHDGQTPLPRREGCGYADDAGAEHDDVDLVCVVRHRFILHISVSPPSTGSVAPVMWPASLDNRNATAAATPSGSARRACGFAFATASQAF